MQILNSIQEALAALSTFTATGLAALPEHTADNFNAAAAQPNVVDRICETTEALFAALPDLDTAALGLCASLAQFATINSWHGLNVENRGGRIMQACQRELAESPPSGMSWPEPETDPEPLDRFLAPAE